MLKLIRNFLGVVTIKEMEEKISLLNIEDLIAKKESEKAKTLIRFIEVARKYGISIRYENHGKENINDAFVDLVHNLNIIALEEIGLKGKNNVDNLVLNSSTNIVIKM